VKETVWRHLFFGVVGCLGGIIMMAFSLGHNVITRDDMPALIAQHSPHTTVAAAIKVQLSEQAQDITDMQAQIRQLDLDVARVSEKLGVRATPPTRRTEVLDELLGVGYIRVHAAFAMLNTAAPFLLSTTWALPLSFIGLSWDSTFSTRVAVTKTAMTSGRSWDATA
jgi:hypothetical protein